MLHIYRVYHAATEQSVVKIYTNRQQNTQFNEHNKFKIQSIKCGQLNIGVEDDFSPN